MKNFAEEIAYLYFRLNGFFLLENYITNNEEYDGANHTDTDLLGIRPPFVKEEIGLNDNNDFDERLNRLITPDAFVGLICEVKGGERCNWTLTGEKIRPCIKRLGLLQMGNIEEVVSHLDKSNQFISNISPVQIIKVLATDVRGLSPEIENSWNIIPISDMVNFIKDRMDRYGSKRNSWNFSHSTIFQYLLYEKRNRAN